MRPERSIVKKAIADAGGNLSRAAALLGCTRQTLYTWCYQLGLERFAGIRMDSRSELDTRERKDTRPKKSNESAEVAVYSGAQPPNNLRLVESVAAAVEIPVQATMRLPESLWKRVKVTAIMRGCTVSDYVREKLEAALVEEEKAQAKSRGKK